MQHEEAGGVWMRLNESYGRVRARLEWIKRALTSDGLEMDLLVQTPSSCLQAVGSAPWLCCSWLHRCMASGRPRGSLSPSTPLQ